MLKGRSKTFAPKKIVRSASRNEPATSESQLAPSTRQNTEPSLNTDASNTPVSEVNSTPVENTILKESRADHSKVIRATSSLPQASQEPTTPKRPEPDNRKDLKRPIEDNLIEQPSAKRVAPLNFRPIPEVPRPPCPSSENISPNSQEAQHCTASLVPSESFRPADPVSINNSAHGEHGMGRHDVANDDPLFEGQSTQIIPLAISKSETPTHPNPRKVKEPSKKSFAMEDEVQAEVITTYITEARKRGRPVGKRANIREKTLEGAENENIDTSVITTHITGAKKRGRPVGKRANKREKTPEGAENEKIDTSVITMQDLCKDLRIGKKSKNHDEIMGRVARLKRNAMKSKVQRDFPELAELISAEESGMTIPGEGGPSDTNSKSRETPPPRPTAGPKMRIVDGQIVTDEQSLQIDLHQRARANAVEEEVVEENDFTRMVTSGNYLKRERAQHWDDLANELFWKGLRMFGTDFEMIARMFPHRSRRQIKLKFNSEERNNPKLVNRVLMGKKTEEIDLDEFQRLGNLELEDLAVIKAEEARIEEEQSEQLRATEEARREETRLKKAAIHGAHATARLLDGISDDNGSNLNYLGIIDKPKPKKSKKNMHSAYGGGEEVIVLETA